MNKAQEQRLCELIATKRERSASFVMQKGNPSKEDLDEFLGELEALLAEPAASAPTTRPLEGELNVLLSAATVANFSVGQVRSCLPAWSFSMPARWYKELTNNLNAVLSTAPSAEQTLETILQILDEEIGDVGHLDSPERRIHKQLSARFKAAPLTVELLPKRSKTRCGN